MCEMDERTKAIADEMEKFTGCLFITRPQLMKFMGYSTPASVDKYLFGLKRNGTRFFINDVARKISENAK